MLTLVVFAGHITDYRCQPPCRHCRWMLKRNAASACRPSGLVSIWRLPIGRGCQNNIRLYAGLPSDDGHKDGVETHRTLEWPPECEVARGARTIRSEHDSPSCYSYYEAYCGNLQFITHVFHALSNSTKDAPNSVLHARTTGMRTKLSVRHS